MDLKQWLEDIGLGQYVEVFEENQITLDLARDLNNEDLKDLGMSVLGHRKTLLRAIDALSAAPDTNVAAAPKPIEPRETAETTRGAERRRITVLFADLVGNRLQGYAHQDVCACSKNFINVMRI